MDTGQGNLTSAWDSTLPIELLPDRLESGLEHFDAVPEYQSLRACGAIWLRDSLDEDRAAVGQELLELEPLLEQTALLEAPNVAGMGVGAWERSPADERLADMPLPERSARRMFRSSVLAELMEEEPVVKPAEREGAPAELARAADLIEAIQRIDGLRASVAPSAEPDVAGSTDPRALLVEHLAALRSTLTRRLTRERQHHVGLDAELTTARLVDVNLPDELRRRAQDRSRSEVFDAGGQVLQADGGSAQTNPYEQAIEAALAVEQTQASPFESASADELARLADLRIKIADASEQAAHVETGSTASKLDKLRRLLAEEVTLTGGRPAAPLPPQVDLLTEPDAADRYHAARAVDTVAIRRQWSAASASDQPASQTRSAVATGWAPRPGLPEIPIFEHGQDRASVIGYLTAGEPVRPLGPVDGPFIRVPVPGRSQPGWISTELVHRVQSRRAQWTKGLRSPTALPPQPPDPKEPRAESPTYSAPARSAKADRLDMPVAQTDTSGAVAVDASDGSPTHAGQSRRATAEGLPISIGQIEIDGLSGPDAPEAARLVDSALEQLGDILQSRLANKPELRAQLAAGSTRIRALEVDVDIFAGSPADMRSRARVIAGRIAEALLSKAGSIAGDA